MTIKTLNELPEETIDVELTIHDESIFTLSEDLKNHSRLEAKYLRWFAQAAKKVNDLNAQLEYMLALVTDEICERDKVSPYQRSEIRRSKAPLDDRISRLKKELNKAIEVKDYLEGLTKIWFGRGFRLSELTGLADRFMFPEPKVYGDGSKKFESAEDRMDNAFEKLE